MIATPDAPERLVRQGLALLEADFRSWALRALSDWDAVGVAMPALFPAVAALQRPSWGHWNGLLTALREARKSVLLGASAAARERARQAADLEAVLDFLDREAGPALADALRPLAALAKASLP